jgi:hypothetical protein
MESSSQQLENLEIQAYEKELCITNSSLKTYLVVIYEGILSLN